MSSAPTSSEPSAALVVRWRALALLLAEHGDLLRGRRLDEQDERALQERGWREALLAIDEEQLAQLEGAGPRAAWPRGAPETLRAFSQQLEALCGLPLLAQPQIAQRALGRAETPRKAAQVAGFLHAAASVLGPAKRVVDVGSGHGHLTRAIALQVQAKVVGLERNEQVAERARELSQARGASFEVRDVLQDGLDLGAGDCVVGLHACGELGDVAVAAAAHAGASIALVGCCLQKQRASQRIELARPLPTDVGPWLPKELLGLSNLTPRDLGVEATRQENLVARERRLAVRFLLEQAGVSLASGQVLRGLNRRAARAALPDLVERCFGLRGLACPSAQQIQEAGARASIVFARQRRLSLPRAFLGRAMEVFVLVDRALFLSQRGFQVRLGTAFGLETSARNLMLVGTPPTAER